MKTASARTQASGPARKKQATPESRPTSSEPSLRGARARCRLISCSFFILHPLSFILPTRMDTLRGTNEMRWTFRLSRRTFLRAGAVGLLGAGALAGYTFEVEPFWVEFVC